MTDPHETETSEDDEEEEDIATDIANASRLYYSQLPCKYNFVIYAALMCLQS